jgi:hypothetical protein
VRRCAVAAALAALAAAPAAGAAPLAALPSPVAPLSPEPPLSGGASASTEGVAHRVAASTTVDVGIGIDGAPFAITATHRLDVRVTGDYYFTIGAPVTDVRAAAGSGSTPGLRAHSIVWAGFNPAHRTLSAVATLDPVAARAALPLRVRQEDGRTVLENATTVSVASYSADAPRGPLLRYLERLRSDAAHGRRPIPGSVPVTSSPARETAHVVAPLRVTGLVGRRRVDVVLRGRLVVPATGRVVLRVEPLVAVPGADLARIRGRSLFRFASNATLAVARARQYEAFLGNPDPTGRSETTYVFRTGARPVAAAPVDSGGTSRSWLTTLLAATGLAGVLGAGVVVWSRS